MPNISYETYRFLLKTLQLRAVIAIPLTTHVGRHSFGTPVLEAGVPIENIAKMTRHASIASTQIYAQITDRKISRDMDRPIEKSARPNENKSNSLHDTQYSCVILHSKKMVSHVLYEQDKGSIERRMSQTELSIRLGKSFNMVNLYVTNKHQPIANSLPNSRHIGYGRKRPVSPEQETKHIMKLMDITKGSEHDLCLFSEEKIAELESRIVIKEEKKGSVPSISTH